jgi:hypothetical protein
VLAFFLPGKPFVGIMDAKDLTFQPFVGIMGADGSRCFMLSEGIITGGSSLKGVH